MARPHAGDVLLMLIVLVLVIAVARWVLRAVLAYPGISTRDALAIEAGTDLTAFGERLSKGARERLANEDV